VKRQFDSPTHALVAGELYTAVAGPFALSLSNLFHTGCDVEPVMAGTDYTREVRVTVAGRVFVVRVDEVAS
jgi:hypothetical protein